MQKHSYACINYDRQDKARQLIGKDNTLLRVYDALLFTWQNSTFQHQGRKVSCPTLKRLAELTGLSIRTIQRAIKKLMKMGLITSFIKRLFNGTVRLFFEVVIEKLDSLAATGKNAKIPLKANKHAEYDILSPSDTTGCHIHIYKEETVKEENNNNYAKAANDRNNGSCNANVAVNSLATAQVNVALTDNQTDALNILEDQIGGKLTTRQNCRINGAINNLIRKEGIRISDPKGLKAQVAFKILLKSDKSGGSDFQHQLNAAMKLIREGKWSTPHGYYNHSDEGRVVKTGAAQQEEQWQEQKRQECQVGGFTALAAACRVDDQVSITTSSKVDAEPIPDRSGQAMTSTDRLLVNGQFMLKSDAKARLDSINESIKRHLERAKTMPDNFREVMTGVIERLKDEAQEIGCLV